MGLSLRENLFHRVAPKDLYGAVESFFRQRGQELVESGHRALRRVLHEQHGDRTLLNTHGEPFEGLRQLQLHVSRELACKGFLLAVHKSEFWGYEFSNNGTVLDHFIQHPDHLDSAVDWFPGEPCTGSTQVWRIGPRSKKRSEGAWE